MTIETDREARSIRKAPLGPLIKKDGIEAVVWCERGHVPGQESVRFSLTKLTEEPPESAPFNNVVLDAPNGLVWRRVAESAFKLHEAASVFSPGPIDILLGDLRCRVEGAQDRQRTKVMAVVVVRHPVIKSFSRMVRGAVKRIERADIDAMKREPLTPPPTNEDSL